MPSEHSCEVAGVRLYAIVRLGLRGCETHTPARGQAVGGGAGAVLSPRLGGDACRMRVGTE